jgi:nitrogen fixation protein NifX
MTQSMTREAALRIALAAKALDDSNGVHGLVHALSDKLGLPLTENKLSAITVDDLREIFTVDPERCKSAVRLLWGEGVIGSDIPMPDGAEDDMPRSIRVACASNRGEDLDGHFGSCERFLIYQVAPGGIRLIATRSTLNADHAEDRNASRAELINDCQLVYVQSIGGPAAAKVVRAGVHPVKIAQSVPARECLAQLQVTLNSPPPWLAKVMGVKAASLEKFIDMAES